MSRQPQIRWRESDKQELKRVVRNFNAKIRRLQKKDPSKILNALPKNISVNKNALPEMITERQLMDLIHTRADLNRELNRLKRFSKKGAEKIVLVPNNDNNIQVTNWQKVEMNRMRAVVNRKREERLELIRKTQVHGQGYTLGQLAMGSQAEQELRPASSFTRSMGYKDMMKKYLSLRKESQSQFYTEKDYQVRENYIKGLKDNYSENDVKDIIDHIEKMPIKEFLRVFRSVDLNTFEWASGPPSQEEYDSYVKRLRTEWIPEEADTTSLKWDEEANDIESNTSNKFKKAITNGRYINMFHKGRLVGSFKDYDTMLKRMKKFKEKDFSYNITL